jgi:hypothetical protein
VTEDRTHLESLERALAAGKDAFIHKQVVLSLIRSSEIQGNIYELASDRSIINATSITDQHTRTHSRSIRGHPVLYQCIDHAGDGITRELLIPQRIQDREPEFIVCGYARGLYHCHDVLRSRRISVSTPDARGSTYLEIRRMTLIRRQALLQLTNTQQLVPLNDPTQLPNKTDMLCHIPAQLFKLGVRLDEAFHIGERLHRFRVMDRLRARLVGLHVGAQCGAEVAKVGEELGGVERVRVGVEDEVLRRGGVSNTLILM